MVNLLLKVLFYKEMNGIRKTGDMEKKGESLISYAQRFDDYCGYEALIILLVITVLTCQVFSFIPFLTQQAGVIIKVIALLIFSTSKSLVSSLLFSLLSSYLFTLHI